MNITMNEEHLARVCEETTYQEGVREGNRLKLVVMSSGRYRQKCIGLAHNQIKVSKRVYIIKDGKTWRTYINPTIVERQGESFENEEGCMSYKTRNVVKRWKSVVVRHLTKDGYVEETFNNKMAIVHQHENDHLNGLDIHHQPQGV